MKYNYHSLPQGYDTLCGFKGNQMSGGQKQRIAIARALIRQPKVLVFDEATSALDGQSEKCIQETLFAVQNDHTYLTIAHRLSTIRDSEEIIVIDQGHVKESGTHEDLMLRRKTYYELSMSQERNDE
jgi:ATP-binding cassette, subfamily B (MDR/TAP), member 1